MLDNTIRHIFLAILSDVKQPRKADIKSMLVRETWKYTGTPLTNMA